MKAKVIVSNSHFRCLFWFSQWQCHYRCYKLCTNEVMKLCCCLSNILPAWLLCSRGSSWHPFQPCPTHNNPWYYNREYLSARNWGWRNRRRSPTTASNSFRSIASIPPSHIQLSSSNDRYTRRSPELRKTSLSWYLGHNLDCMQVDCCSEYCVTGSGRISFNLRRTRSPLTQ